ncbi:hypothetical protein [Micromonospora okii]|uniref:hypothetical protein n=1 Tax=Micromonospora okii TaxID=1182970 RepID=UPI001E524EBF|nr:hypothetical protein [Micromonospora okii]
MRHTRPAHISNALSDAHAEWKNALGEAASTGRVADRERAEEMRQKLGQHPSVVAARRAVKGRLAKVER